MRTPRDLFKPLVVELETFHDEIDAVADGRKPMSWTTVPPDDVLGENQAQGVQDLLQRAFSNNLAAVMYMRGKWAVDVIVARSSECWRIAAFVELQRILETQPWTQTGEAMKSALLGYSIDEVKRWLSYLSLLQSEVGGFNAYVLLSPERYELICSEGMRAFPIGSAVIPIEMFTVEAGMVPLSETRNSEGGYLCRLSLEHRVARVLFSDLSELQINGYAKTVVDENNRKSVNQALRGKIETWSGSRWE